MDSNNVEVFTYIIIGAGSAGCVLANRLSENSQSSVLLLEAGGTDSKPEIHDPSIWPQLLGTEVDWGYWTEAQTLQQSLRRPENCVPGKNNCALTNNE